MGNRIIPTIKADAAVDKKLEDILEQLDALSAFFEMDRDMLTFEESIFNTPLNRERFAALLTDLVTAYREWRDFND